MSVLVLGMVVLLALVLSPRSAAAAEPPVLWQKCAKGSAAGQCGSSLDGIATSPISGSIYVADTRNNRINEFSVWGAFLKSWGWGVADGSPELQTCGPAADPPSATCQAGIAGTGPGQFAFSHSNSPRGLAVDSTGNIYVYEAKSCTGGVGCEVPHANRVQKFDPDGNFLLAFGREVNQTKVQEREEQEANAEPVTVTADQENVCTAASGDSCGGGTQGSGPGQFGTGPLSPVEPQGSFIAVGPDGHVHAGGQERIQVFDAAGHYLETVAVPGESVKALAVDSAGDYYLALAQSGAVFNGKSKANVRKLDPNGSPLCEATVEEPNGIAVDPSGGMYVVAGTVFGSSSVTVHHFGSDCGEDASPFVVSGLETFSGSTAIATGSACGLNGSLYYANQAGGEASTSLRAYRPAPDPQLCPAPPVPPTVADQYAETVNATSAVVRAWVNPHFWPDATYYVQWGSEDCRTQVSACEQTRLFPGTSLGGTDDVALQTSRVTLQGLQPDTTYYFRFVAQSGGGGPVYGLDPDGSGPEEAGATTGLAASFITYPLPRMPKADCPNQPYRIGPAGQLPSCRAYEMVSPVEKNGGDIFALGNSLSEKASLNQSAGDGERMAYSSYRAFGDPQSAPYNSQYLAVRGSDGWTTEPVSPPANGPSILGNVFLESSYKAFDEELCSGWVLQIFPPPLTDDAPEDYANLYRRRLCGNEPNPYEAASPVAPAFEASPGSFNPLPPGEFLPSFQGFSADGTHTVFRASGRLTEDAAPCAEAEKASTNLCPLQVYDSSEGQLHFVCVLPSGKSLDRACSAGTGYHAEWRNTSNSVYHAVSADGSRIFWTDQGNEYGKLYVRIDNEQTVLISGAPAWFWTAAEDGSRVLFSQAKGSIPDPRDEGDLVEFDLESGVKTTIAGGVTGVMGASADARRVYFTSREVLDDTENGEGDLPEAGKENLYLYEAEDESFTYVATLVESEVGGTMPDSPVHSHPFQRTSRVSADGLHAAFTSHAPLSGANNTDVLSGEADAEVFLYDASSHELRCVSCNPSGAAPSGRQDSVGSWYAGTIPHWTDQTHPSRVLSQDGDRLFFDSVQPLVLADRNGARDVYEWQAGESPAECEAAGAELFLKREGGCLSLISSGTSHSDSTFVDADRGGQNVFFSTDSSLLPQDPGLIDIYDARVGGGFPPPAAPAAPCEGEACQGAFSPPEDPTPASSSFEGAGNERKPAARRRCAKGKVRRHQRCARKHRGAKRERDGRGAGVKHGGVR